MIKLFANTYRYISFAIANEFFEICQKSNLDWSKIWFALKSNYPRAANLPNPGFASGPCLIKDTQHLNFFYNNNFKLGLAALDINQGLPLFCVKFLENNFNLSKKTVGILGMTFKSEVDDFRSSHSFDLKYLLEARGVRVLCSDEVLQHNYFVSSQILLAQSDIVIIATPHEAYKSLIIEKPLIDIWHCTKNVSLL
jgi:UDP-N-acetyl-D-mannosaminuronic acid dehydrogenase